MSNAYRFAGVVAAPLLIAGCGMPIGVQIASLLADTVSVITTDKTLSDHGISAVIEKDCALWRTVEGNSICREMDDVDTTLADASFIPPVFSTNVELSEPNWGATATAETNNKTIAQRETPEFPMEEPAKAVAALPSLAEPAPEVMPAETELKAWTTITAEEISREKTVKAKTIAVMPAELPTPTPLAKLQSMVNPTPDARPAYKLAAPAQPATRKTRQTFFVIASYHQKTAASQFSRKHDQLEPTILEGTAHGKRVYRVAIGPVAREDRKTTQRSLKYRGFSDAWALTVRTPKILTEVAGLR